MNIAAFLLGMVGALVGRVLFSLGLTVVTITGVGVAVAEFKPLILGWLGQAYEPLLQLAGLAGAWIGLGAMFGAVTFAVTMWTIRKATSILGVG